MQKYAVKKHGQNIISKANTGSTAGADIPNSFYAGDMSSPISSDLESGLKSRINSDLSFGNYAECALSSLHSHERQMTDNLSDSLKGRFGVDMRGMRIFEDDGLQERFGQRAYAKGNEIHLSKGEYSPDTRSGLELIMHEAGHVVQQGSSMVHSHGITENAALEAQADGGFAAPDSFSMPVAGESSAIQGWNPWQKLKSLFSRRRIADEPAAEAESDSEPESQPEPVQEAVQEAAQPAPEAPAQAAQPAPEAVQQAVQQAAQEAAPAPAAAQSSAQPAAQQAAPETAEQAVPEAAQEAAAEQAVPEAVQEAAAEQAVPEAVQEAAAEQAVPEAVQEAASEQAAPEEAAQPQRSRWARGWDSFKTGASKFWGGLKWGTKAVLHGVRNLGKKFLDTFNLIDSHVEAVDQLNNFREDYDKMSRWNRFCWTFTHPLARIFAGAESESTKKRNLEAQLVDEETANNTFSVDSDDAKAFDEKNYFDNTNGAGALTPGGQTTAVNVGGKLGTVGTVGGLAAIPVGLFGNTGMNAKEKNLTLGTKDYAWEGTSAGIASVSDLLGVVNNTVQAGKQMDNGNDADAARNLLATGESASDFFGHTMRFASNAAGKADKVGLADVSIMPSVDVVSGALKIAKGAVGYGSAKSTENAMNERLASGMDPDSPMYKASMMARNKANINKTQGKFDMASGALRAAGGALKLGGVTSLVGTAVSGIGSGVNFVGTCVTDEMKKEMRTDLVNQELDLDNKAQQYAQEHNCDQEMAKRIILKSMGYQSGRRKEVFNNIVLNRAAALKKKADSGDEDAVKFMEDLGLKPAAYEFNGQDTQGYSLQAIAEKLGMEDTDSWETQLEDSRKRRILNRANPFPTY